MSTPIADLTDQIAALESELEVELAKRRAELRVGLEQGRVVFEEEILRRHRELRTKLSQYILRAHPLVVLTAPVIYSLIFPLLLLDLFVTVYQAVCFPVYGIAKVRRGDYLIFDRYHLGYLNALEKLNCAYCAYANGLIGMSAKSPDARNNIGVRSSTRVASSARTRIMRSLRITAMRPPSGRHRSDTRSRRVSSPCAHTSGPQLRSALPSSPRIAKSSGKP